MSFFRLRFCFSSLEDIIEKKDRFKIGELGAPHGLRGQLYAFFYAKEWLSRFQEKEILKKAFLLGSKGPSFSLIESVSPYKKGALVELKDIRTRLEAEDFKGFSICVPLSLLNSRPGESIYLHEILGFTVKIKSGSSIGVIKGFSSNGPQDLLTVETSHGMRDIPLVEDFVSSLSFQNRWIEMNLPEGLLSL